MQRLTSSQFGRHKADPDHPQILDDHWSLRLKQYAKSHPFLIPYVSGADWSDVTVHVAGKNDGPNAASLESANVVLANLEHYLKQVGHKFNPVENAWIFTAIYSPYQFTRICYLQYWSEYGVDIEYGIKLNECKFGSPGVLRLNDTDNINIAWLPNIVNYGLNELSNIGNVDRTQLSKIRETIRELEIMGPEIFDQLNSLVQSHYRSMSDPKRIIQQFRAAAMMLRNAE